jgi:cell division protein FtsW (lipid II flippase)
VVRQGSRAWWRHLVAPVIGFVILAFVVVNANVAAQTLGFVWLGIGVVLLVFLLVTGRRPSLNLDDTDAAGKGR